MSNCKADMQMLLALLRALRMVEHTLHWQAKGDTSYSDHLLFGRLYEAIDDEIDGLGERIVFLYGNEAVSAPEQAERVHGIVRAARDKTDPVQQALEVETLLQKVLHKVHTSLQQAGELTLGLDNFLQGIADAHDTARYLLKQRAG